MKKIILTKDAPQPIGPYSQAVLCGGTLYCSGQIPLDPKTGSLVGETVGAQTEQVVKNIFAVLSAAGFSFSDVVKTTCYLTDMAHFSEFNKIYETCFSTPARTTVAVKALPKNALVEIEAVAVK